MKKIFALLMALTFALALGITYAEAREMDDNGITVFSKDLGSSISAGWLDLRVDNGITVTASAPVEYGAEGSAAGGLNKEEPAMDLYNGITIFHAGPVSFD